MEPSNRSRIREHLQRAGGRRFGVPMCFQSPPAARSPVMTTLTRELASHFGGTARDPLRLMMVRHETLSYKSKRGTCRAGVRGGSRCDTGFTLHGADSGAWTGRPLALGRRGRQSVTRRDQPRRDDDLRRHGRDRGRHLRETRDGFGHRRGVSRHDHRRMVDRWRPDRAQTVERIRADRALGRSSDRDSDSDRADLQICAGTRGTDAA